MEVRQIFQQKGLSTVKRGELIFLKFCFLFTHFEKYFLQQLNFETRFLSNDDQEYLKMK